jgi:trigger factor
LSEAFDGKELEWVLNDLGLTKDADARYFQIAITKIGLVEKADLNEEFFLASAPGKDIKTEEAYRNYLREEIQAYWDSQTGNQLQHTLYHELLEHTNIEFPEAFLKRWMQTEARPPRHRPR